MNKRGFTLIELLAVIVILAIIALIATPIVLSIINESKESSQLRSAEMYKKGLETSIATAILDEQNITDKEYSIAKGNLCLQTVEGTGEDIKCVGDKLEVQMNGEVPESGTVTIENGKIKDISLAYSNGKTIVKNEEGKLEYSDDIKVKYIEYSIGDEVTIGEEKFYVIEDSDSSNPNVTLLSKYNLNSLGTAQLNASYSETKYTFSSTNYWSTETSYPLNLNNYTIPEGVTSIITTANAYGTAKGGTGRLLTKEEATQLRKTHDGIISGTTIDAVDGILYYWLGTADDSTRVYTITGIGDYYSPFGHGVRPVVEISKKKIN